MLVQLGYYNVIVPAGKALNVNNIMYLAANSNIRMYWLYYGCIIIVGGGRAAPFWLFGN